MQSDLVKVHVIDAVVTSVVQGWPHERRNSKHSEAWAWGLATSGSPLMSHDRMMLPQAKHCDQYPKSQSLDS